MVKKDDAGNTQNCAMEPVFLLPQLTAVIQLSDLLAPLSGAQFYLQQAARQARLARHSHDRGSA